MNGHRRYGWGFGLAAVLFSVALAMLAYNAGVSEGIATSGSAAGVVRGVRWGWGGGIFLWPLLWVFFWAFLWRGACWGRRYWYGGPYRSYGPPPPDDDEFDRWHRRAHERMTEERPADDSGRRG